MDSYEWFVIGIGFVTLLCIALGFWRIGRNTSRSYKEELKCTLELLVERSRRITHKRVLPEFTWWLR